MEASIRARRAEPGITQGEATHRAGLYPVEFARAERGLRDLRVSTLTKIAAGLEAAAEELVRSLPNYSNGAFLSGLRLVWFVPAGVGVLRAEPQCHEYTARWLSRYAAEKRNVTPEQLADAADALAELQHGDLDAGERLLAAVKRTA